MADVVGDPDNQEDVMCQQLIAEQQHMTMQIVVLTPNLAESEEKLKLQKKQSSESERLSPDVPDKYAQKVSEKRPLEDQESHRASKKMKIAPLQPELGGGSSPIYDDEQKGRIDRSSETKWPQDRFNHRSQNYREPHERYRDLPPAERGQPHNRPPERPHWERRQQDENLSGGPGRNRNFNKQDGDRQGRQRENGPKDVRYDFCRRMCFSSPEKMDELQDELSDPFWRNHLEKLALDDQNRNEKCELEDQNHKEICEFEHNIKELAILEQDETYWKERMKKLELEQKERMKKLELKQNDRMEKLELEQKDRMEKSELEQKHRMEKVNHEHNIKELAILELDETYWKEHMEKLELEQKDRMEKLEVQQKDRMEKLEVKRKDRMEKLELEQKHCMEKLELEQNHRMQRHGLEHNIKELAILEQDRTYWKDRMEKLDLEQKDRMKKLELEQKDCMEKLKLQQNHRMEKLELEHNIKELAILEQDKTYWKEHMEKLKFQQANRMEKLKFDQKDRMEKLELEQNDRMEKLDLEHNINKVQQHIKGVEHDLYSMLNKEGNDELKLGDKMHKEKLILELTTLNEELSVLKHKKLTMEEKAYCKDLIKKPCQKKVKSCEPDGINMDTFYLSRSALMNKVKQKLEDGHQFILLSSPAGSGKTSLLTMMEWFLGYTCIYISCLSRWFSSSEILSGQGKDDYNDPYVLKKIKGPCIVMLDDAQARYNEPFWAELINNAKIYFPRNIQFIIAATHPLDGSDSPPDFSNLVRFSREDFLLSDDEAILYLTSSVGLRDDMQYEGLLNLITWECAGHVGALQKSVFAYNTKFRRDKLPSETDLLHYCLSTEFVQSMEHCFGGQCFAPISENFRLCLTKCFVNQQMPSPKQLSADDSKCFKSLIKRGLLIPGENDTIEFMSAHLL